MKLQAVDQTGHSHPIEIDLSKKIGEGATAAVYRVIFHNELWAAKIYKPERAFSVQKLEAMLESPPGEIVTSEDGQTFIQYTWVKFLLKDTNGALVGFLMHFVDQRSTNSLDTYYDHVLIKRLPGKMHAALSLRLEIAHNLCDLIDRLHDVGHYFIDIKPQNIRVYRDNNKVVLMDCDGYSIKSNQRSPDRFPADLISTDFIAPEVLKNHLSPKSLGEEQDRYGLAVLLFQLLNRGTHPFQGVVTDPRIQVTTNDERAALGLYPYGLAPHPSVKPRPQSIHDLLPDETRSLFDQAFITLDRPTAKEWKNHFRLLLDQKQLIRCKDHPSDIAHIHFSNKGCIGCKIEDLEKNKVAQKPRKYKAAESTPTDVSSSSPAPNTNSFNSAPIYQTSSAPKSKNTDLTLFAVVLAVIGLFIFATTFSSSNNSSVASSNATNTVGNTCADYIRNSTYSQLCTTYWSDPKHSCTKDVEKYLISEKRRYSPFGLCGQTNPKGESYEIRVARYQQEMMAASLRVIPTTAQIASTSPGYINKDNRLPPGQNIVSDASATQILELYQTWWYTQAQDFLYLRIENMRQGTVSGLKVSAYDHCSSDRKIVNSFLLTPNRPIGLMEVGVLKVPMPLPSMQKFDQIRCLDIEMVLTRDTPQTAAVNNQQNQTPAAPTHDPSIGFGAIYFDNNSNGFSWTLGYRTLNEAKSAARKSCQERSGPLSQCTHSVSGNYRCVAITESSKYRHSMMADSLESARKAVQEACLKVSGGEPCVEPYDGAKCLEK